MVASSSSSKNTDAVADDDDATTMTMSNDDNDNDDDRLPPLELPGNEEYYGDDSTEDMEVEIDALTVPQLQQQLRLRGIKVSGKKAVLRERLLRALLLFRPGPEESTTTTKPPFAARGAGNNNNTTTATTTAATTFADVTEYLDDEDRGKAFKTLKIQEAEILSNDDNEYEYDEAAMTSRDESSTTTTTEVWGSEARLGQNRNTNETEQSRSQSPLQYSQRKVVVDALSTTILEYRGSNQTYISATVIASRDALKPMLRGGGGNNRSNNNNRTLSSSTTATAVDIALATEQRLYEIQMAREKQWKRPLSEEDEYGLDEGDETGLYQNVLHRDYSDWGKYSMTGAQLSAQEVAGIILLPVVQQRRGNSDHHQASMVDQADDIIALAEKIAFECQPVIVMIPDIYPGYNNNHHLPWTHTATTTTTTDAGHDDEQQKRQRQQQQQQQRPEDSEGLYDEWHPPRAPTTTNAAAAAREELRLSVNIRAAAACLRDTYRVSSVILWGVGVGGGRALVEASGSIASIHDVDGRSVGPPPVQPAAVIVWYPTFYCSSTTNNNNNTAQQQKVTAQMLFGKDRQQQYYGRSSSSSNSNNNSSSQKMALMGVFGGMDKQPGATKDDAVVLKALLADDERIVDHMIKVFPGQDHGFAHIGLRQKMYESSGVDPAARFVEEEFGGTGQLSNMHDDDSESEVACLLSTAFMETYSRVFLPTVGTPIAENDAEAAWGRDIEMKDWRESRKRDVRAEIRDALRNAPDDPPMETGPLFDPSENDIDEDELKEWFRAMESPNPPERLKIEDDDDLITIYAKLTNNDENFQIW
jgi:dienelactone hydrolase